MRAKRSKQSLSQQKRGLPLRGRKLLSLVVPAYKHEKTIKKDLKNIDATLREGLPIDFDYEIICVVDGFLDGTFEEAKKLRSSHLKVFGYEENAGKGQAVRYGMARGFDFIFRCWDGY